MKNYLYTVGILTPLLYVFNVVLGGALWPGLQPRAPGCQ